MEIAIPDTDWFHFDIEVPLEDDDLISNCAQHHSGLMERRHAISCGDEEVVNEYIHTGVGELWAHHSWPQLSWNVHHESETGKIVVEHVSFQIKFLTGDPKEMIEKNNNETD